MLENSASIFTNSPLGSRNQAKQITTAAGALEDGRPDVRAHISVSGVYFYALSPTSSISLAH